MCAKVYTFKEGLPPSSFPAMQSQGASGPVLPMIPPRMATGSLKMAPQTASARPIFRRQNSLGRGVKQVYQSMAQPMKTAPGAAVPMMPRFATSNIIGGTNRTVQPQIPMPEKQNAQTRLLHPNVTRTATIPPKGQGFKGTPRNLYSRDTSPSAMPRQATGMSRAPFVPRTYVTNVYPSHDVVYHNRSPTSTTMSPVFNQSRANTAAFSQAGQRFPQSQVTGSGHVAFKGRNKMKATSSQRRPSVFKEVIDSIKEHTPALPVIDTKEAVQLVGGFVSGTLSVLAHIVGDIRGDIINGLFKVDDPSYDAARSYYYAANNHPAVPTGMTQRIDYIEEIEKCTRNRTQSAKGAPRANMKQRPSQPVYRPHPPTQQTFKYEPQYYEPAPQPKVRPTTFGQDPHMFSMMSERTLEEFLLNDGYLNSAPPSIPR
ncbi:hypothetical protein X943_000650 [Babesia divergens]|uniref:Uncharacterized protein n=1 Tax=Babesia divergens TaxID=32595 RepID=A0AAD9G6L8_BABDI|nr:hypothetical protein X943_000650 [Babesia divergens]